MHKMRIISKLVNIQSIVQRIHRFVYPLPPILNTLQKCFKVKKKKLPWKRRTMQHIDPFYVSFIRRSQERLKCHERFTVKQVLGLIAAMILLLCINSVIVVTKSICHDTWGVVKLFNVYYKNSVLMCSPTSAFSSLLFASTRPTCMTTLPRKDLHTATCSDLPAGFNAFYRLCAA